MPRTDPPIAVFYHVARMGRWEAVDAEIQHALAASGLLARADFMVRNDCRRTDQFEFPTLDLIRAFAAVQDAYILYVHTKGVTHPIPEVDDWRAQLLYWNVTRWQECVAKLKAGYDAVGTTVIDTPIRHFQGNVWWARASHLRKLPDARQIQYKATYDNQTYRHRAEFWVLSIPASVYQPYHHKIDPYCTRNPASNYVGQAF